MATLSATDIYVIAYTIFTAGDLSSAGLIGEGPWPKRRAVQTAVLYSAQKCIGERTSPNTLAVIRTEYLSE